MQFSAILTPLVLAACVILPSISPAFAQGRDNTHYDEVITDMARAYKAGDSMRLTALLPQVRGYLLEPWAAYWELSARLDTAEPAEVEDFFSRYRGSYQEDKLRTEWMLLLGKNRDWAAFNRAYAEYRMHDDKTLHCYALLAEHLATGADIRDAVMQNWLSLRNAEEGCSAAAEQLVKDHAVKPATVWPRARLGMENNNLAVVTQAVGIVKEGLVGTVNSIHASPAKYLDNKITALREQTRELVSLAIIRLAALDLDAAVTEVKHLRWRAQLTQEERNWIWGVIGVRAARKMLPQAVDYFAQGDLRQMHEDHLEWAVRAALRAGQWQMVRDAIAAMPPAMAAEPAWAYWHARALLALNSDEATRAQATALFQGIASVRGFYEQLALEELGQSIVVPQRPAALTVQEREAARTNPSLVRALYAIQIGLRSEGVREWNYGTNLHVRGGLDDRAMLAAADLACRAEVWDRCINSSERTRDFMDFEQRFPMPFRDAVLARSKQIGIDPAYVYGLIRQESRFIMDARSSVGASGLMQVMPATARWTAKKIGMTDFQSHQINDRDVNIAIGTGYLKLLLDSFEESMPMATAAYNAGPGRPRNWRNGPVLEAAIWAENIPFTETRDYVKKVLANTTNYAAFITGQPQSLKARLGRVGPLQATIRDTSIGLP